LQKNFLTFVDAKYVKAHSRATLAGYEVTKKEEVLMSKFERAAKHIEKRKLDD
jgi:hypothetical protein